MANLTTKRYLENYNVGEKTTVVDIHEHPCMVITEPGGKYFDWSNRPVVTLPSHQYLAGEVVDRLAAFESLGMEPEDIRSLAEAHHELLEKRKKKKVVVQTEFTKYLTLTPDGSTYSSVKETRYYRCPCCGTKLDKRYKTTKLYPNRTIGTEGVTRNCVQFKCGKCDQALDWDDANKETWS